mmetsp:Transcript_2646/g.3804  ORF Transcript_2646/g.3804 Transcript_2646/m.3804 type:complete len:525 (-) Transcript_2646:1131-2705(-)
MILKSLFFLCILILLSNAETPYRDIYQFNPKSSIYELQNHQFEFDPFGHLRFRRIVNTKEHTIKTQKEKYEQIVRAIKHAYKNYERYAFGHDEIKPINAEHSNQWGAYAATLVDSLDTIYLAGMHDEFEHALYYIKHYLKFDEVGHGKVSFFETTIRVLGGLLGGYSVSKHPLLIQKAVELADRLILACNTPSNLPYHAIDLSTGEGVNAAWTGNASILSEVGSFSLEFSYLSAITNDPKYKNVAEKVIHTIHKQNLIPGLYALRLNLTTGGPSLYDISFGGLGDSFYEYLLKYYLMSSNASFLSYYNGAIEAMQKYLLEYTTFDLMYLKNLVRKQQKFYVDSSFEHLTCFVPGLLTLGYMRVNEDPTLLIIAKELLNTCVLTYQESPTGLAPDRSKMINSLTANDFVSQDGRYFLRPETIESLYYMYQATKDERWREAAWTIFEKIEEHCRVAYGYSGIVDVYKIPVEHDNAMPSFFIAETLKYLLLLFDDNASFDVHNDILTTEAHILKKSLFEPYFSQNKS